MADLPTTRGCFNVVMVGLTTRSSVAQLLLDSDSGDIRIDHWFGKCIEVSMYESKRNRAAVHYARAYHES